MKEKRFYFEGELSANMVIEMVGEEFHHLANVMRAKTGDKVCLFNGNGNFYLGKITEITKKYANIDVLEEKVSESEPKIKLTVFQALAKGDKLSLIMQKITELGASKLALFESKFCDVKANTGRQEKLSLVSAQAAKQCGRASLVETEGVLKLSQIAEKIKEYDDFFVAYENSDGHTLVDSVLSLKNAKNIAVMIGAEGGFSEDEIELLKANGADVVSLGKRILRTETAAIACTALIMQLLEK